MVTVRLERSREKKKKKSETRALNQSIKLERSFVHPISNICTYLERKRQNDEIKRKKEKIGGR